MSRRGLLGTVGILGATALSASADEGRPTAEDGDIRLGDPVVTRTQSLDPGALGTNVSPDGHAMTVFFGDPKKGDLQIGLGGSEPQLGAVKLVTIQVPVRPAGGKTRLVGYGQHIRGFIRKTRGSRVVIVADCGGSTRVIEYPFGQELSGQDYTHSFFSADPRLTGDPQDAALPHYDVTLTLLAQVRAPEDAVLASIDSLDVEAQLSGAPTPARRRPADPYKDTRRSRRS